jgi:signal transduction histidine kinase
VKAEGARWGFYGGPVPGRGPAVAWIAVDPSARLAIRPGPFAGGARRCDTGSMTNAATRPNFSSAMSSSWRGWMDAEAPPSSIGWQLLWTAVWAAGFAFVFTVIGFTATARTVSDWIDLHAWGVWFGRNYVVAAAISFTIQGLFRLIFKIFGVLWLPRLVGWRRTVFFSGVPLLGTAIGWPIGMSLIYGRMPLVASLTSGTVVSLIVLALMMSTLFHLYFSLRHKEMKSRMRANEAQLRLLQGQMEPHFLFNTLANVISLIDADAPRAKHMLESLTDYLRASLVSLRHDDSTLAAELDLAGRYLDLMRTRMGERLRFEIDVDDSVRQAAMMPLVLQPLIENAVKHGLEPQVDGGTVRVKASREQVNGQDSLRVCVEDNGAGIAAASRRPRRLVADGPDGHGIALANLRERLQTRFGTRARLTLEDIGGGPGPVTLACLVVPWRVASAAA